MKATIESTVEGRVRPLTVSITLETKEEMLMLAAVFNSGYITDTAHTCKNSAATIRESIAEHLAAFNIKDYYGYFVTKEIPSWAKKN